MRRPVLLIALLAAATGVALPAWAQSGKTLLPQPQPPASQPWPTKALKLLVGFPAGSGPDLMARLLTDPLSKVLGQSVVVENRPGASGNLAADQLAKATDDHTIGLLSVVNLTTAKMLYEKLSYDPSDFQALTMVGTSPLILVASTQAAPGTASDFLLRARSEAVRRNIQVTVTPVNDEAWNEGWSINNPGKPEALLVQDAMRNTTIAGPEDVTYLGNGRVSGNATLTFNIASGDSARCIKLDVSGRPTQSKGACPAQA